MYETLINFFYQNTYALRFSKRKCGSLAYMLNFLRSFKKKSKFFLTRFYAKINLNYTKVCFIWQNEINQIKSHYTHKKILISKLGLNRRNKTLTP
jgi:hypothetical protein